MRFISKLSVVFCIVVLLCLDFSCKKKNKDNPQDPAKSDFDRKGMLTNIGNTVILPAYQSFNAACIKLDSTVADFNLSPDSIKLSNLQTTFKNTYRAWESVSPFDFGPADQQYLGENVNIFPTDTVKINSNINSSVYDLAVLSNLAAKGLPAMDYLLFGIGTNNHSIVLKYTTDSKATNRKQYLAALSAAIRANMNAVLTQWGSYMATFQDATGTDIGSSLGQFINGMDKDLDGIKNFKIGIPLGKQSMGAIFPGKVEGYYCGISSELAVLNLKAIQSLYSGKGVQGNDLLGLDDNLDAINAQYNNGSLNTAIKNQFTSAISKLQVVPDPLSGTIVNNPAVVNAAYVEIQKLIVLLKTDMPSSLGVLITYEDNDGD